ncbi:MAG: hypothetical protein KTR32_28965 [Granulosicoccus sp.]|nr:hypothetical protein [Granulosicoccus sp.]
MESANITQGQKFAADTEVMMSNSGEVIHSWRRKPRWPDGIPPAPIKTTHGTTRAVTILAGPERARRVALM